MRQPLGRSALRRFASSLFGEPFSLPPTKSCPRLRGKCRGVAVTKGERLGDAEHCEMFPLSLFAIAHRQLPRKRWRLLGDVQTLTLSLPHRGRWILRSKSRRELKKKVALLGIVNPSVTAYAVPAPRRGEPLVRFTSSNKKPPSPREVAMSVSELTEGVIFTAPPPSFSKTPRPGRSGGCAACRCGGI